MATLVVALIVTRAPSPVVGAKQELPASTAASSPAGPAAPAPAPQAPVTPTPTPRFDQQLVLPAAPSLPLDDVKPSPAGVVAADAPAATLKPLAAYPQNIANRPVPRIGDKPWLISEEWQAHHERQLHAAGRAGAKLLFLGDSITEGWGVAPAWREYFGKYSPLNLGLAGDTTQNVLWRIEHGALDGTHPQVVVLMVGVNNLAGGFTPEQTSDGIRAILSLLQAHLPATRVLLLAVLPARQDARDPLRQRIKDTNRLLESLATPGRVELHDVGSVLLEPDGSISKSTLRDFVHPTPEGFERLSRAVAPFLDALMAHAAE